MSFLRWFGKRDEASEAPHTTPSELGASDATLPLEHAVATDKSSRRSERMQRRELLYGVVRESMTAAGLLSSTYKFKVLSLDSSGREYLIMVDVPHEYLADTASLVELEGRIARSAKERYDMRVTAVYWRVNDMVTPRPAATLVPHTVAPASKPTPAPALTATTASDDALADEVLAFKKGLTKKAQPTASSKVTRRAQAAPADFSDTEPFDPNAPLGPTQYGGLQ